MRRSFSTVVLPISLVVASAIAFDRASAITLNTGDVVVLESFPNRVVRVDPVTGVQTQIAQGLPGQLTEHIEYAPWGKLYAITRLGANSGLVEIDPATGGFSTISTGQYFVNPRGLDFTAAGDVIVVDTGSSYDGRVLSVDRTTGIQTKLFDYTSFGPYTYDGAVAPNGDLYVTEESGGLAKYNGVSVATVPHTGSSVSGLLGLTFADAHHLLLLASSYDAVRSLDLTTGIVTNVTSGGYIDNALDIATNRANGKIYIADYNHNYLNQYDPITNSQSLLTSGNLLTRPTGVTVVQPAVVPEPASLILLLLGAAAASIRFLPARIIARLRRR